MVDALRGGHPRRTAECCRWRRRQRWPGRWGDSWSGYKGVDSKVHPKGGYDQRERERERKTEKRKKDREQERWKGREKGNTGEFTSPGEFLQDLISRARARARRAHVRRYALTRAKGSGAPSRAHTQAGNGI